MNKLLNRESETDKRRQLLGSMRQAEVIFGLRLKGRQWLGCGFRRQYGSLDVLERKDHVKTC
jgi:hypothetical protein